MFRIIDNFKKNNPESGLFYVNFNKNCDNCEYCQELQTDQKYREQKYKDCSKFNKCDRCDNNCLDFAMFAIKNFDTINNIFYIFLYQESECENSAGITCTISGKIAEKNIIITSIVYCTDKINYKNNTIFNHEEAKQHIKIRLDYILLPICENYTYNLNNKMVNFIFTDECCKILSISNHSFYRYYSECFENYYSKNDNESPNLYTLDE